MDEDKIYIETMNAGLEDISKLCRNKDKFHSNILIHLVHTIANAAKVNGDWEELEDLLKNLE